MKIIYNDTTPPSPANMYMYYLMEIYISGLI